MGKLGRREGGGKKTAQWGIDWVTWWLGNSYPTSGVTHPWLKGTKEEKKKVTGRKGKQGKTNA